MLAYLMSSQSKRYVEDVAASTGQLLRTLTDRGQWDLAAITVIGYWSTLADDFRTFVVLAFIVMT